MAPRPPPRKRRRRQLSYSHQSRELQNDPIFTPQFNIQQSPVHVVGPLGPRVISSASSSNPPSNSCAHLKRHSIALSPRTPDLRLSSPLGNQLCTPKPDELAVHSVTSKPSPKLSRSPQLDPIMSSPEHTPHSPGLLSAQPSLLLLSLPRTSTPSSKQLSDLSSPRPKTYENNVLLETPIPPDSYPRRLSFGVPPTPCQLPPDVVASQINAPPPNKQHGPNGVTLSDLPDADAIKEKSGGTLNDAGLVNVHRLNQSALCFPGSSVYTHHPPPRESNMLHEKTTPSKEMCVRAFRASGAFTPELTSTPIEATNLNPVLKSVDEHTFLSVPNDHVQPSKLDVGDNDQTYRIRTFQLKTDVSEDVEQISSDTESLSTAPPSPIACISAVKEDYEGSAFDTNRMNTASVGIFCRPVEVSIPGGALRSPSCTSDSD